PLVDLAAGATLTTGVSTDTGFAVERLGKNPRNGGFTHTPCAGKEVSVVQAIVIERINQRAQDMLLPYHLLEITGTPLAGQNLVTHDNVRIT
ncbi:MAG: Uncharacterized protein FD130_433, partial [Halothiobacillaceae bacterium]